MKRGWGIAVTLVAATIVLVVIGTSVSGGFFGTYAQVFWWGHLAFAHDIAEPDAPLTGAAYADVETSLGHPDYEAPGFTIDGFVEAAVCVWDVGGGRELRALVIDDRVVAAREGVW
ncbi:MAG: hypothetical protein QMC79_09305 [Anaerosomatales bacterium]|nr:hypothetical protein [Anaerosomatales bacterium]